MALEEYPLLLSTKKTTKIIHNARDANSSSSNDPGHQPTSINHYYVMCFIAWLYLFCGISQAKCREALEYVIYLIKKCRHLPPDVEMETKIPRDVRIITKHLKFEPEIELHVCCRKCYSLYDIETSPFQCGYKATPQSPQRNQLSHPTNPTCTFVTQDFLDWIKWFLSLPEVETSINEFSQENVDHDLVNDYLNSRARVYILSWNYYSGKPA
ncbi:hypothetical protein VP01_22g1 [Puccinia sorghi]|uniref:Uncharacterized protein n=1 Tax=Puccinia sorghi TaxID=27349 RepID=A0A0L6V8M8_9BASI|nr:hypothetical protein VP01_22g1 [Puccinia sorghi]